MHNTEIPLSRLAFPNTWLQPLWLNSGVNRAVNIPAASVVSMQLRAQERHVVTVHPGGCHVSWAWQSRFLKHPQQKLQCVITEGKRAPELGRRCKVRSWARARRTASAKRIICIPSDSFSTKNIWSMPCVCVFSGRYLQN